MTSRWYFTSFRDFYVSTRVPLVNGLFLKVCCANMRRVDYHARCRRLTTVCSSTDLRDSNVNFVQTSLTSAQILSDANFMPQFNFEHSAGALASAPWRTERLRPSFSCSSIRQRTSSQGISEWAQQGCTVFI